MALTAQQRAAREGQFSASFAPYLMAGDDARILNEWRILVGEGKEEDLSHVWAPSFGAFCEPFILDWHQRKTGKELTKRGERVTHGDRQWCGATLDAYRSEDRTVIDCKVVGAWRKLDDVCAFYAPQVLVQRDCMGADNAALLIVHGSAEPVEYPIHLPDDYAAEVWDRIDWFWKCVETLTPPVEMPAVVAPPAPMVEYLMESNQWADEAGAWLEYRASAKRFQKAEKELKLLVPADAKRCHGFGIEITRNAAGSLSIKEAK